MNFPELVSDWDMRIRLGQGLSVSEAVLSLNAKDIPNAHLPAVASIARRLGLLKHGLDLLRAEYLEQRERNPEQLMTEYAALLTEVGAVRISETIFSRFAQPKLPMTFFYRALLWIRKWEHEKAAADLKHFKAVVSDPYWRDLADLNLLASLIFLRHWDEAHALQSDLEVRSVQMTTMSKGILSELKGQLLFFNGKLLEARAHFTLSIDTLSTAHNPIQFFAEKWILLCDLLTLPWPDVESRFHAFKERARQKGYWEVLRELDRFFALRTSDENILAKLYFGTPAPGYKQMLCRDLNWTPPNEHFISIGERPGNENFLNAATLELFCEGNKLMRVPRLHLLLIKALTTDLYRPLAMASIFESLYHGQHFDPFNAAQRVHQAISRFRKFASTMKVDLKVESQDLGYQLQAGGQFAVRYEASAVINPGQASSEFNRLKESFGTKVFSAADVAEISKVSQRSANRLLSQFVEAGEVEKVGAGKGVRYRVKRSA